MTTNTSKERATPLVQVIVYLSFVVYGLIVLTILAVGVALSGLVGVVDELWMDHRAAFWLLFVLSRAGLVFVFLTVLFRTADYLDDKGVWPGTTETNLSNWLDKVATVMIWLIVWVPAIVFLIESSIRLVMFFIYGEVPWLVILYQRIVENL